MKKIKFIVFALIILIIFPYAAQLADFSFGTHGESIAVTVPQGSSTSEIGKILKKNGLVKSSAIFVFKVKTSKYKNSLNYGTFSFKKGMTNSEIIKIIGENAYVESTVKVTFPEGSSVEQMAQIVQSASLVSETDFLNALNESYDYEFLKYIPTANYKYKLQGCLFPSTYEFFKSASAHEIVDKMLAEQQTQLKKLNVKNENVFDTLIKASIIEKEAKLDSERATVAGVIENRLAVGMPLQIDACVVYAVTDGLYNISVLYENQLKTNSPYNTYKNKGLPPGPICCPGANSIKAAQNPEKHNYYYYHTDEKKKDGSHIFTETFDEHTSTMK